MGDQLAGRYRLDRRLGQGGMGEVWRGHDLALDRSVAVKVLLEAATNDEVVARFRREATIGARLQHPGITVVHDVGQQDGRLFIVMELLAGEDLATMLARDGRLAVDLAVDLAAQTAEALAAAHEQSVVHRDLKPANLFLLPGRRLKICDFGIAYSADATAGWTVTGRMFGTPAYMAPEQWRGERVGARCDLYALGCVLYALLSGAPPFGQSEGPYVLMRRHIEEAPLSLREVGAPVPPELDRLVRALLAKDPEARPESAQSVGKTLRGLRGAGAVSVASPAAEPGAEAAGWSAGPGDGDGWSAYAVDGPGAGGVSGAVREFVRELVLEAEDALRAVPATDGESRVEVLTAAADAAARFDAGLAGRLLAEAELAAWTGGAGDGARVSGLLTALARDTAPHAPARARRLLTDAHQALFTVSASRREGPLRALAEELVKVDPEQASRIAGHHFRGRPARGGLRARIEAALAAARPEEAERQLARIGDPGQRAAGTYDLVVALAPRDLPAAMRLSEHIGSAGGRLLVLCQLAQDRAAAGDPAGASHALEQAEEELPRVLEERAAWLREEADQLAGQGQPVEAERLRHQAAGLLRGRAEASADEKAGHALAALEAARARVAQATREPLDRVRAQDRADRARSLPEPAQRALALAGTAHDCLPTGRTPWLPEAAADAGTAPPPGTVAAISAESASRPAPPDVAPGQRRWHHDDVRPDDLRAAGDGAVWRSGPEVGLVRAATGAIRWTAFADEGVPAAPLPGAGAGRLLVSCAADAATVYVGVSREGAAGVRLVAREPRDGRVRWWRDLPQNGRLHTAGPVLLHEADGELTARRSATGAVLWRVEPDSARFRTVVGNCVVLTGSRRLEALHLSTGERMWSQLRGAEAFERTSGVQPVHLVDLEHVRALDRGTGRELWRFAPGIAQGLLVERGTVYGTAYRPGEGDVLYALDAQTGALRWQRVTRRDAPGGMIELLGLRPGGLYVEFPPGGRRGLLNRSADAFVAVLDPATGKPRRRWEEPGRRGSTLLIGEQLVLARPELKAVALP
ncbi:protein kinase [Streptomyces sp. NBC_00320]|uniref:protein kinase domain-containing protein n=1 Tax=Streptomyces sp. NBC_00320 TaxID=2975711 RepID=UPI0022507DBB|nr:protein kinase [Streptomyces sp. NBC_00320]MCX5145632.1 protein kinase [Streptomyces sp. NBC_00320]